MITKTLKNLLLLIVAFAILTFVSCAEDDDGPDGEISGTLIGTWTGGSATVNSFLVNGEDISSFIEDFIQLLIDSGLSQEEANVFAEEFENGFAEGFTEIFEGTFTFNEDGTYSVTDSEGSDSGTWELANDDQTVVIDRGTEDEIELEIVSLTESRFEGLIVEFIEDGDLDGDGIDDTIALSVSIVFTR